MIAANEKFTVKSGDIRSAFLQGQKLNRSVFVKPPKEASVQNKLWKLNVAAYGILDGGRMFYLRLVDELLNLGLHKVHADGAIFTYVKEEKLMGFIVAHVDDLFMAGNDTFHKEVTEKLQTVFQFSKISENSFKYCGCQIKVNEDGVIELNQNEYIDNIKFVERKAGPDDRSLNENEN